MKLTLFNRLFVVLLGTLAMPWFAQGETFNLAEVEVLHEDQAFLVPLAQGTRRARITVKDDAGTWQQFVVTHLAGDEGMVKMRAPDNVRLEDCRVEVSMTDPFPYSFYQGATDYSQQESAQFRVGDDFLAAPEADGAVGDQDPSTDTVQESDLWQWRGETLYFFNQRRGLQVFDLSNPEKPRQQATLRMPAVGDQMYVLDDQHVLLLANYIDYSSTGWWDIALPYYSRQQTEAIVVRHDGDELKVVSRVAVDGNYVESRLVGTRLYMATQINLPVEDEEGGIYWRNGLQVNGIDFATPNEPQKKDPLELVDNNGWFWGSVVTATPEFLLVSTARYDSVSNTSKSRVFVIPIGRDIAELKVAHEVDLKAQLNDKFKLRVKDGILTTVTQKNVWREELTTYVESFDLSDVKARKLDELLLAPQERLHATRFDGDRLYVVTFFVEIRKDPLFVIDLTDPSNLKSLGELEIPGWSTYLVPEGGRLLSIGLEDGNVAISLFDVSDPSKLKLLKRVYPGEGRSWSEATWDEKAVGYLTEQDLLLLPIQTYNKTGDGNYEYHNLMQIVDVLNDDVVLRGSIEHEVQGRRATALGNYIASISGTELIVVDAEDRDHPQLVADLTLAWDAYRVLEHGDYLLQFENGQSWNAGESATIRVTTKDAVDVALAEIALESGGVVGVTKDDRYAYVARLVQHNERVPKVPETDPEIKPDPDTEPEPADETIWEWVYHTEFHVDVIDLNDPTEPRVVGTTKRVFDNPNDAGGLDAVVGTLLGETLVWRPAIQSQSGGYYGGGPFVDDIAIDVGVGGDVFWGRGYYGGGYPSYDKIVVVAVDIAEAAAPEVISSLTVDPKDYAEFGPVSALGSTFYVSYKESQLDKSIYTYRHKMRTLDFSDPAAPRLGNAVSVPGMVEGVFQPNDEAVVLFSTVPKVRQDEELWFSSNSLLQASVFDGTSAFLVSQVTVEDGRYTPTVVIEDRIVKPGYLNEDPGLRVWRWKQTDEGGELGEHGFVALATSPSNVANHEGLIFAEAKNTISVLDKDLNLITSSSLSGPVYTQSLQQVDVSDSRQTAWIATGQYGIESITWSTATVPASLATAAQSEEPWTEISHDQMYLVTASHQSDFVGPLNDAETWRFRSFADLVDYQIWAWAHFDPTGDLGEPLPAAFADNDGDGFNNLEEFVWGTQPLIADTPPVAGPAMIYQADGTWLEWSFPAKAESLQVKISVEQSVDLANWVTIDGSEVDGDRIRMPLTLNEAPQAYFRLQFAIPANND